MRTKTVTYKWTTEDINEFITELTKLTKTHEVKSASYSLRYEYPRSVCDCCICAEEDSSIETE